MDPVTQGEESGEELVDLLPSRSDIEEEPLSPEDTTGTIDADSPGRFKVGIGPWVAREYVAFEERLAQASKKCPAESSDGALTEDTDDSNESPEYEPSTTEKCLDFVCEAYTCSDLTGLGRPGNEIPKLKQLEKFATPELRKAKAHGVQTIMGIMRNPYTPTCLGAFFRDFSVYGFCLLSVCLWINVVAGLIHDQVSDEDEEDDPYRVAKLILSTFAMLFAVADLVHHTCTHEYLTCKECTSCEEDSDSDKTYGSCPCPKFCPVMFDGARLILTELINYPNLLLSIFQLIVEMVAKDGKADATTYISVILTSLIALLHVYIARWFMLAGSIFSIQKIRTGDKEITWRSLIRDRFHVVFVLNAAGHTIIQIMMIAAIGTRFSHEYRNLTSTSSYVPSGQLWYMMFFAYVGPFVGVVMFLITCHIWTQQFPVALVLDILKVLQRPGFVEALESHKREDEFSSTKEMRDSSYLNEAKLSNDFRKVKDEGLLHKLGYPFKNPFHILLCLLYCSSVIAFWVCTKIDGPESAGETAFYYLAALYAVFVNSYAFAIALVWATIFVVALFGSLLIIIGCVVIFICSKLPSSNTRRNEY